MIRTRRKARKGVRKKTFCLFFFFTLFSIMFSFLGNPTDRGAWQAAAHGLVESQTQLSN